MSFQQRPSAQQLPAITINHFSIGYYFDGLSRGVQDFQEVTALNREPLSPVKKRGATNCRGDAGLVVATVGRDAMQYLFV
jgi:hypothetical protein